jgi:hypothetical protein
MNDPDADLSSRERTRRSLHRSVDRIIVAWPHALVDASARGYSRPSDQGRTCDVSDPTGNSACRPDRAVVWLVELRAVVVKLTDVDPSGWGEDWTDDVIRGLIAMVLHRRVERLQDEFWIVRVIGLANRAAMFWPTPPAKGDVVKGVTVGQRGNSVEMCGLCGEPAPGGRNDDGQLLVRRLDGVAFHAVAEPGRSACFWQVWRQRRAA